MFCETANRINLVCLNLLQWILLSARTVWYKHSLAPPVVVKFTQLCLTLCNPMNFIVHGILQARILEWVAFPFSSRPSWPRNWTRVTCIAGAFFTNWAMREAPVLYCKCWTTDSLSPTATKKHDILYFHQQCMRIPTALSSYWYLVLSALYWGW